MQATHSTWSKARGNSFPFVNLKGKTMKSRLIPKCMLYIVQIIKWVYCHLLYTVNITQTQSLKIDFTTTTVREWDWSQLTFFTYSPQPTLASKKPAIFYYFTQTGYSSLAKACLGLFHTILHSTLTFANILNNTIFLAVLTPSYSYVCGVLLFNREDFDQLNIKIYSFHQHPRE